jgi:hypothetical protein
MFASAPVLFISNVMFNAIILASVYCIWLPKAVHFRNLFHFHLQANSYSQSVGSGLRTAVPNKGIFLHISFTEG